MGRKISNCEYCGKDIGPTDKYGPDDIITCGERECERWARDCQAQSRAEAHEQLDRDLGY